MMRMIRIMLTVVLLCPWISSAQPIDGAQGDDLQRAAEDGNVDLVRALIAKGADVNAKDAAGKTALMYAASKDHVDILNILLQKGADIDAHTTNATPKSVSKKSENKMLDICSGMRYEKEWKSDLRIPLM